MAEFDSEKGYEEFLRSENRLSPGGQTPATPPPPTPESQTPPSPAPSAPQSEWVSGTPDEEPEHEDFSAGYGAPPPPRPQHSASTPSDDSVILEQLRQAMAQDPDVLRRLLGETQQPHGQSLPPGRPYIPESGPHDLQHHPGTPHPAADAGYAPEPAKPRASDRDDVAQTGWRGWVARTLNIAVPKSSAEQLDDVVSYAHSLVQQPLDAPLIIGVTSFKGGVGKSPFAVALGKKIAEIRNQPVVALDADLYGTLLVRTAAADYRARLTSDLGTMTLLASRLRAYGADQVSDVGAYAHPGGSEFYAIPGNRIGHESELTAQGYQEVIAKVSQFYQVIIVDMAQVSKSDLFVTIMKSLTALVMITPPNEVTASFLENTAGLLKQHGIEDLGRRRITVINNNKNLSSADPATLTAGLKLNDSETEVAEIPFDKHIAEDDTIDLDSLSKDTQVSLALAAGALFDAALAPDPSTTQTESDPR